MTIHAEAMQLLIDGRWQAAHQLIQNESDPLACQIHGLLHLIEGDHSNAAYWYHRAGMQLPDTAIEQEKKRLQAQAFPD